MPVGGPAYCVARGSKVEFNLVFDVKCVLHRPDTGQRRRSERRAPGRARPAARLDPSRLNSVFATLAHNLTSVTRSALRYRGASRRASAQPTTHRRRAGTGVRAPTPYARVPRKRTPVHKPGRPATLAFLYFTRVSGAPLTHTGASTRRHGAARPPPAPWGVCGGSSNLYALALPL